MKFLDFEKIIKWWLIGLLIFLPFHYRIVEVVMSWNYLIGKFIRLLDEITIIALLPFALKKLFFDEVKNCSILIYFSLSILFFIVLVFISGIVNGNSLFITVQGIFDYVKYFMPVFIYAYFFRNVDEVRKAISILIILGACLGIVALMDEIIALSVKYIWQGDSINLSFIYDVQQKVLATETKWRLGLFRSSSLMGHYNLLGMYGLLLLSVYLFTLKRINTVFFISLFSGVFLSISRTIYIGYVVITGVQILKGRRWLIISLIPVVFLLFKMSSLPDFDIQENMSVETSEVKATEDRQQPEGDSFYMRDIAREKAVQVWKDHPVLGVGAGMFGSPLAVKSNSYVHYNYMLLPNIIKLGASSIDQFWFQILAETGIVGVGLYIAILLTIFIILYFIKRKINSFEVKGLMSALSLYMLAIGIYGFGANIIMVELMFTYSAMIGMALGISILSEHCNTQLAL